jgi:hypothetical protein
VTKIEDREINFRPYAKFKLEKNVLTLYSFSKNGHSEGLSVLKTIVLEEGFTSYEFSHIENGIFFYITESSN